MGRYVAMTCTNSSIIFTQNSRGTRSPKWYLHQPISLTAARFQMGYHVPRAELIYTFFTPSRASTGKCECKRCRKPRTPLPLLCVLEMGDQSKPAEPRSCMEDVRVRSRVRMGPALRRRRRLQSRLGFRSAGQWDSARAL